MSVRIHLLRPENERESFRCGKDSLDRYLAEFAWQNMARHKVGVTYVAEEAGIVLGYVTVAAGSLERDDLPASLVRRLPAYPLPMLRVARLAVDERFHGKGIGSQLLGTAFDLALEMSERIGCVGVVVDVKPNAEKFYARFGFEVVDVEIGTSAVRPRLGMMFIPLGTIGAARE